MSFLHLLFKYSIIATRSIASVCVVIVHVEPSDTRNGYDSVIWEGLVGGCCSGNIIRNSVFITINDNNNYYYYNVPNLISYIGCRCDPESSSKRCPSHNQNLR